LNDVRKIEIVPVPARLIIALALLLPVGCATQETKTGGPNVSPARASLILATNSQANASEASVGYYLDAAHLAAQTLAQPGGKNDDDARNVYNQAAGRLTVLLRSKPEWWNRTETFHSPRVTYRLRFAPEFKSGGIWSPDYFTFFRTRGQIDEKLIKEHFISQGLGGILVGVRKVADPKKYFYPPVGVSAPVTATLDFAGHQSGTAHEVTLTLCDPAKRRTTRIDGQEYPLAADFSAPFAYYPARSDLGIEGMLDPIRLMKEAGIYITQPYDRQRIPVLFVHGLGSAPQTWRTMINAIDSNPRLRGRFQFWIFDYPSGEPPAVSALRLRKGLQAIYQTYPQTKNMVVVGHSLGGLIGQMQVVNTGRVIWDEVFQDKANEFFASLPADALLKQALIFNASPRINEVVFICTPHYGSNLATGFLADLVIRLIRLPGNVLKTTYAGAGESLRIVEETHDNRVPDSIQGLSPKSPLLLSLNTLPIQVPFYSIIGNRGRPGPLAKSSDGIVPYWSSHLPGAQSETIVPYGHVCLAEPLTIDEVNRILHIYLTHPPPRRPSKNVGPPPIH
jgi:Alpha/beta hydrolase family